MRHEQDRRPAFVKFFYAAQTAMLKDGIAHREGFIDDQNIRLNAGGNRKRHADVHAARISLDGLIKKIADLGETFDLRKEPIGFAT